MATPGPQILQSDFDTVASVLVAEDGTDANGNVTFAPASTFPVGAAVVLPSANYGQRITSIDASIDCGIDFPRGLRVVVLALNGDVNRLASIIGQMSRLVAAYQGEVPSLGGFPIFCGAYVPDMTAPGRVQLPNLMGFMSNAQQQQQIPGLRCLCDYRTYGGGNFGASNGSLVQTAGAGDILLPFGEQRGALQIPKEWSAAVLLLAYRPYTDQVLKAPQQTLQNAVLTGAVHGYRLSATDVQDAPAWSTPSKFGNIPTLGSQ